MPYSTDVFEGARCANPVLELDPEVWFDPEHQSVAVDECRKCPAQQGCLGFALAGGESTAYGVWGGVTAEGRSNMLRYGAVTLADFVMHSPQAKWSS